MTELLDEQGALREAGRCGAKNTTRWRCAACDVYPRRSELREDRCPGCAGEVVEVPVGKYLRCHRWPRRGRERCDQHGGLSLRGPASPAWGTGKAPAGKYSMVLGGRYLEAYERARADPGLPHLLEQIALVEAREAELVSRIEELRIAGGGETGGAWAAMGETFAAMLAANEAGDTDAFGDALDGMGHLIHAGRGSEEAWAQWLAVAETRRKLVATQRQLVSAGEGFVAVAELLAFAARFVDGVRRHVTEPRAIDGIIGEIEVMMGGAAP